MLGEGPLALVLELERGARDAARYAAALRALAEQVRREPAARDEMTAWLLDALGLTDGPAEGAPPEVEARWDAAVDIVADAEALGRFLEQVAARLEGGRLPDRLNLLSLLRTKVVWRSRDRLRRRRAWASREVPGSDVPVAGRERHGRVVAALVLQRVGGEFAAEPALVDVLARLLKGESVTEVARETGIPRPTIYRWLARVRAWIAEGTA